jgi:hypothetical protein
VIDGDNQKQADLLALANADPAHAQIFQGANSTPTRSELKLSQLPAQTLPVVSSNSTSSELNSPRGHLYVEDNFHGGHRFADDDIDVAATVDLGRNETGGFVLAVALAVTIAGIDQQTADRLIQGADAICP